MPRIVTTATFESSQALRDAQKYAADLKGIFKDANAATAPAAAAQAGASAAKAAKASRDAAKAQGEAAQKAVGDLERLNAELKLLKGTVATVGLENMDKGTLKRVQADMERIRKEALALSGDLEQPITKQGQYAALAARTTQELDRLAAAQRGAAGRAGAKSLSFGETDGKGAEKAVDDAKRLRAELQVVKGTVATIGLENMDRGALAKARADMERIRSEALTLSQDTKLTVEQQARYAALVERSTQALDKLAAAQRGAASRGAATLLPGAQQTVEDAKALDSALTRLEANRKAGLGTVAAYRAELKRLQGESLARANDAAVPGAVRDQSARSSKRALNLIAQADQEGVDRYNRALEKITQNLVAGRMTAQQAEAAYRSLAQRTDRLSQSQDLGAATAAKYGQIMRRATQEASSLQSTREGAFIRDVKALDEAFTKLEANRKAGLITAQKYREELVRLQQAAQARSVNPTASGAEQAMFASKSTRGLNLINKADEAEARKLTNAVVILQAQLKNGAINADQARAAFDSLAARAQTLSAQIGLSSDAVAKFAQASLAAKRASAATVQRAGGAAIDAGVTAARDQQAQLRALNDQRRAGLITNQQYRASIELIATAARQEAASLSQSSAAQREYARTAAQAQQAKKKLNSEMLNNSTGGSAAFALNSLAFGFGAIGAGTGMFLQDALQLNEQAKQSALTLQATAKFYKQSVKDVLLAADQAAAETRQDDSTAQQATANLLRKYFTPEAAREAIKRFSDAATAAGLDATKAIVGASEAILSEQSRQLNSAGIAENLGPELTKMQSAMRKGEESFKSSFLTSGAAREQFEQLRAQGVAFQDAAKGATLYQFILKATDPVAGRTASSLNTLTGALNNYNVQYKDFKKALVEGISQVAVPVLNVGAGALKAFNEMPQWVKSTAGLSAALVVATLATVALTAASGSLYLQSVKVFKELEIGTKITRASAVANATLNTSYTAGAFLSAAYAAAVRVTTGAVTALGTAAKTTAAFLIANPAVLLLAATVGLAAWAKSFERDTAKIYDDIEARDKEFRENLVAKNGQEFVTGIDKLMQMQEVMGVLRENVNKASTPQDQKAAQEAVDRYQTLIDKQRAYLADLSKKREAERGAAAATDAQAEAYRRLQDAIEGVQERFGNMKLTSLQSDIRSARKEQERLLDDIKKGEKEYTTSNQESGLTPDQAKKLRGQVGRLLPESIQGLVSRQLDTYADDAVKAQLEMERARIDLMKDGAAKRAALLKVETEALRQEYAKRIEIVEANQGDANLTTSQKDQFARESLRLQAERDEQIKLLEQKSTADLEKEREDRAKSLLGITRAQADAEVNLYAQLQTRLAAQRDRLVESRGSEDLKGRLAVEEQFAGQVTDLAQKGAKLRAALRVQEAQQQLAEDLKTAEGSAKATADARRRYALTLQSSQVELENDLTAARVENERRVQDARAAITQQWVDDQLTGINDVEGAQLASLQRQLRAYETALRARGDTQAADAVAKGIKQIADEARSRVVEARRLLKDGEKDVQSFGDRLDELTGKAAKGLTGAKVAAFKPFGDLADQLAEDRAKAQEVLGNLMNPDAALEAQLNQRIALLAARERQVRAEGEQAALRAGQAFTAAQRDKAVQAAAKTAATLYDGGQGDTQAFRAALSTERTYWQARLQGLEEGSSEYEAARARIEEINQLTRDTRKRDAQRPVEDAQAALDLLEAQLGVARTEAERNALLERRVILQRQLAAAQRGAAGSGALSPQEERQAQVAALKADGDALAGKRAIREEQDRLTASLRSLADAQVSYALTFARTDAEVAQALMQQVALSEQAVRDKDGEVARLVAEGAATADVNRALTERVQLQGQADAQRQALARRGFTLERDTLDVLEAQAQARLALAGIQDDGQLAVTLGRTRVQILRDELAATGDAALNADQRRAKEKELAQALAGLAGEEQKLAAGRKALARDTEDLAAAQGRLMDAQGGMDEDRVLGAVRALEDAQRKVARAQADALDARDPAESVKAQRALVDAQLEEITASRALAQARRDQRDLLRDLSVSLRALTSEQVGGTQEARALREATLGVTDARERLTRAEEEYARVRADFERVPSTENANRLKAATEGLTGAIKGQRDGVSKLAETYRGLLSNMTQVQASAKDLTGATGVDKTFNGNREIDRFYAIQRRRDGAIASLRAALAGGDAQAIAAATGTLSEQEKRYREQADLLKKNGVNVSLSQTKVVEDLARQVDDLGIQYDRDAALLNQRADIAQREAEAANVFDGAVTRLGVQVQSLLDGILKAPAPALTPGPTTYSFDGKTFGSMAEVDAYAAERRIVTPVVRVAKEETRPESKKLVADDPITQLIKSMKAAEQKRMEEMSQLRVFNDKERSGYQSQAIEDTRKALEQRSIPAAPTQGQSGSAKGAQVNTTKNITAILHVDGQPFPTVPAMNELVDALVPRIEAAFADKSRRAGVEC
ncbi:hypothetical protein DM785_02700 [Deinococcus actinosclerus]|nr:hypothetical protein DM785_02700 [Deinococcus actinosclerus]